MLASCFQPRLGAIVRPTKINHPSTRQKKKKKQEKRPSKTFVCHTKKKNIPLKKKKIFN